MPDEDKTFSGSFVLDLRIWWRQVHTLYSLKGHGHAIWQLYKKLEGVYASIKFQN